MKEWARRNPYLSSRSSRPGQWRLRADQRWFLRRRAAYFDYLASLLEGLRGSRTLRDVFADDVLRYGASHPRGRLASQWIGRYAISGGILSDTWRGCVPQQELAAIGAAQQLGNAMLRQALADLARIVRLEDESRAYVHATLMAAWGALAVMCLVLAAIPAFSVPRLLEAFSTVPAGHHGPATVRLIALASQLQGKWWAVLGMLLLFAQWTRWSLHAYCGRMRRMLDRFPPWSLYRYRYSLSFLSMLQLALQSQDTNRVQLRQALAGQRLHAAAWADTHLKEMLARLDGGAMGASVFDTGLLDREHFWFLDDMVRARGMSTGMQLTVRRLEHCLMEAIRRQAVLLRWVLLLSCVASILGGVLWHYAVIDEFRRALMLLYSS
ncbi:hypothetical protein [Paracandidimonas soli]|uniref:hypothetical protein n=1 Tax=Paracandidimonas soli TaxID=1917182 RepID=UPI00333E3D8E